VINRAVETEGGVGVKSRKSHAKCAHIPSFSTPNSQSSSLYIYIFMIALALYM